MTHVLYKYGRFGRLPDMSPFCMKLETWLHLAEIPFETAYGNPFKAPRGKLPYMDIGGTLVPDSSEIVRQLTASHDIALDQHLSASQRGLSIVVKSALEEHFYFVLLYLRWQHDPAWSLYKSTLVQSMKRGGAPGPMAALATPMARRGVLKSLQAQGTGRLPVEEVCGMGLAILTSVSGMLGDKTWFHGDAPSSIDATLFAMVASALLTELPSPLSARVEGLGNLTRYCERILAAHYSELAE